MANLEALYSRERRKVAGGSGHRERTSDERNWKLLPDPERQERFFTIISVDDHIVEPPDMFEGRLPEKFAARAPRIVENDEGNQGWLFEGATKWSIGLSAAVGRPLEECAVDPERFEFMRPGTFDPDARVRDMDIDGVYAQVCFPQSLIGFGGHKLQLGVEPDFALALVRAVNSWYREGWFARHPDRLIGLQIPYLLDPHLAAAEIRRNAGLGFKGLTFPESPEKLGLPSVHTAHWDPIMQACEETGTVICLHVGSSSDIPGLSPSAPLETPAVLFGMVASFAAVDWLFSLIPARFPELKIAMSEGGISWVPGLIDRLNHMKRYQSIYSTWRGIELSPVEIFHRNFWHCCVDDPSTMRIRDVIGVDRIMIESDYPHLDSSWPDTQAQFRDSLRGVPDAEIQKITWGNASEVFRHRVPASIAADPGRF